jgi:ABC-type nitrate/sulfonate/bicarbonate transport system permease component
MTVVAAELVASSAGLGYMLVQAQYAIQPSIVLVSMFIIGLVGGLLSITFRAVERRYRGGF